VQGSAWPVQPKPLLAYSAGMARIVIAGDFGGTNLRAALVTETGEILVRHEVSTTPDASPDGALEGIGDLLMKVRDYGSELPVAASLAVAGLIDGENGRVLASPNIPAFRNLGLTLPLSERLGIPVLIANDASAAALGEFRFGAGQGTRHLLHATLGTGIGGGIVIDGRLYKGTQGLAGELGHIVLDTDGPPCGCGSRGCLEAMAGGIALGRRAQRLVESGGAPILAEIASGRSATAGDLAEAARRGEVAAIAEIREGGHIIGIGLGSIINVLNPDVVTLSGGLLGMGDFLLDPLRAGLASLAFGPAANTPVRISTLGADAGLLGAAAVALAK